MYCRSKAKPGWPGDLGSLSGARFISLHRGIEFGVDAADPSIGFCNKETGEDIGGKRLVSPGPVATL